MEPLPPREVLWLAKKAEVLLADYDSEKSRGLQTFEAVELLWEKEILPEIRQFKSMEMFGSQGKTPEQVPADSVWFANAAVPNLGY